MSFLGNYFNFAGINSKDFGLKIVSINGNLTDIPSGSGYEYQSISAIRNPRKLFLGLKESKDLVDNAGSPIKENISLDEANEIKAKLEEAGATVEVK